MSPGLSHDYAERSSLIRACFSAMVWSSSGLKIISRIFSSHSILEKVYPAAVVFNVLLPSKQPASVILYSPQGSLVASPAATILLLIACAEHPVLSPNALAVRLFPVKLAKISLEMAGVAIFSTTGFTLANSGVVGSRFLSRLLIVSQFFYRKWLIISKKP